MSIKSFNKNLINFIEELNITFPDYPIETTYFNEKVEEHSDVFLKQLFQELTPWIKHISNYDQTIFQDDDDHFVILDKIDITTYWSRNISKTTKLSIFKYLHILYVTAHHHCKNTKENFDKVIENLTSTLEDGSDENSEELVDTETYLKLISNIKNFKKHNTNVETETESETTPIEINNDEMFDHLQETLGISSGGVIGGIAKDIMDELQNANLKEEDFSNPMNMFSMLMGGGGGEDNGLMSIVKNVGAKLHNRLESGNLDQDALMGETTQFMSKLNNSDSPFSNMFGNMFGSQMSKNVNQNNNLQLMKRRQRLKQKLEKKKRELAEAQNQIENSSTTSVVVSETKKKKRRRRKKKSNQVLENV